MQASLVYSTHLLYTGSIFEEDEAKPPRAARVLVYLDGAVCHLSEFIEVIFQILLTRVPAKTADKHFPGEKKKNKGRGNVMERLREANEWGLGVGVA